MKDKILEQLKSELLWIVEEWTGGDIPAKGSEDYDRLLAMNQEIEDVESLCDVVDFLEGMGIDAKERFENHGLEYPP